MRLYCCIYELRGFVKSEHRKRWSGGKVKSSFRTTGDEKIFVLCVYVIIRVPVQSSIVGGHGEWNIFPYNMYIGIALVTAVKWRPGEVFADLIKYCERECECRRQPEGGLYNIRVDFIKRILPTNIFRFVWRQKVLKKAYTHNRSAAAP